MRRTQFNVCLFALCLCLFAADSFGQRGTPVKAPVNQTDAVRLLDLADAKKNLAFDTWIAYGDSITDATDGYGEGSYVTSASNQLGISSIYNLAQGGDLCSETYAIVTNTLSLLTNGTTVVTLMVGVNNFGVSNQTVSVAWGEYKQIIDYVLGQGPKIELYCILQYGYSSLYSRVDQLNDLITAYSVGRYGVIDMTPTLNDPLTGQLKTEYKVGVSDWHPNQLCSDLMGSLVRRAITAPPDSNAIRVNQNGVNIIGESLKFNGNDLATDTKKISTYLRDFALTFDGGDTYTNYVNSIAIGFDANSLSACLVGTTNVTNRLLFPDDKFRTPTNSTINISFFVKSLPADYGVVLGTVSPGMSGNNGWVLYINSSGSLVYTARESSGYGTTTGLGAVNNGQWNNFTISFNDSMTTNSYCLNGETNSFTIVAPGASTRDFCVGMTYGETSESMVTDANYDNIIWYSRQLHGSEMERLNKEINNGFID